MKTLNQFLEQVPGPVMSDGQQHTPTEDPKLKADQKKDNMLKKRVLMTKMRAIRGGATGILASYEPNIEGVIEYFYEEGINEEGFDQFIEEIGLEEFVNFVDESAVALNEERAARRATVRAKKFDVVKKEVDKADAARKKAKKGEYAPSYAKKETDVTVYDDKPAAKKKAPAKKTVVKKAAPKPVAKKPVAKKVVKAVAKVKKTQPVKKPSKQGLGDKIRSAYKAGVKRHRKATQVPRVFAKGAVAGAKKAVKFAKDVKKVVSKEGYQRDPEQSKKDRTHSKQPDPSKDGFTGIGNMSIKDIMKMNAKIKAKEAAKKQKNEEVEYVDEAAGKTAGMVVKQLARIGAKKAVRVAKDKKVRKAVVKSAKRIGSAGLEGAVSGAEERAREAGHDTTRNIGKKKKVDEGLMTMLGKKKKEERKPQKAMDAGARAKRKLARQVHAKYVSGSEDLVPDDIREVSVALDANTRLQKKDDRKKKEKEYARLMGILAHQKDLKKRGLSNSYEPEGESLDERLGGKGYSRQAAASSVYPGKKGTGDWEDSDRGAGNKAKRRAGGKVTKKSPTYLAHVHNKEDYETTKRGEVLSAFKRDPKVRKRFEKAAKKDRGPGSVKNQAADSMLQTAKDIAKRKGDTSKSDDRYAYEEVQLKAKRNPNRLVEPRDGVDSAKEVNRATRRAAFRPFNKEEVEPVDERYYSDNTRGVSTKGGLRSQYNKPGKLSQSSLSHERKSKNPELRMSKKELRTSMIDDSNYERKMGRSKPTPSNLKSALKKQSKIKEDKAFNYVVSKLRKQYGKDAVLTKGDKIKPPTAAQKKAAAAHRAKLAKQDHRDPTEIASSGRYSDRYSNRGSD